MERIDALQFYLPTKIIFAAGAVAKTGEEAAQLGRKALVVTAAQTMRSLGYTTLIERSLVEKGLAYELYEEIETNPSMDTVTHGAELATAKGCDVIIGLGGGSAMDAAKAIASAAGLNRPIADLMQEGMQRKGLPCIVIPTTAGTGAEVTHISVLTNKDRRRKDGLRSPFNFASVAILDPALTMQLPPYITANTGIDALTHAIEAYTSRTAQPISDLYAHKAITLVRAHLRRAVRYGGDLEARKGMMLASNLAGIAIAHAGTGAAHGVGMTVGGVCNADHGTTVGLALPAVIEFNLAANLEKYAEIAVLLGEQTAGLSQRAAAALAIKAVQELLHDLGLPQSLGEIGVTADLLPQLLADTQTQRVWLNNPRLATAAEMESIFRSLL